MFRYKLSQGTWDTSDSTTNTGKYIMNMYKLKRYAEMGIYMGDRNIFVLNNYKTVDSNYQTTDSGSIFRYYYYPNVGQDNKTMFRGNTAKTIDTLCVNMVLVGMNPFEDYRKYGGNVGKFKSPGIDLDARNMGANTLDKGSVMTALYNYLYNNGPNELKAILSKLIKYIGGGKNYVNFDKQYDFIIRLYAFKEGMKRNGINVSNMRKRMEDYLIELNKTTMIIYNEYRKPVVKKIEKIVYVNPYSVPVKF